MGMHQNPINGFGFAPMGKEKIDRSGTTGNRIYLESAYLYP